MFQCFSLTMGPYYFALGVLSWRAPLNPLFGALFIKYWSITLTSNFYCSVQQLAVVGMGSLFLLHSKWSAQASLIHFHFGIHPTLVGNLCDWLAIVQHYPYNGFLFFLFFFLEGQRQLCGDSFRLMLDSFQPIAKVLHYTKRSASQSASQNRKDNPRKKKKSRSVPVQQRMSKQNVGHFGHLE